MPALPVAPGGMFQGPARRVGMFGVSVDPELLRALEEKAAAKRRMAQGLESAAAAKPARPWHEQYLPGRVLAAPSKLFGGLVVDPAVEGITDLLTLAGDVKRGDQPTMSADPQTGEMHTDPRLSERTANAAGTLTLGAGAIPAEVNALRMGIKAYHGSPHDFERFDLEKARAGNYGNAVYLHEAELDANRYKPEGGKTYEVEASFQRPFDMSKEVSAHDAANVLEAIGNPSMAEQMRKSGKGYRSGNELWYWGLGQGTPIAEKQLALKKAGFDSIIGDPGREIAGKSTRSPEIAVFDDKLISILKKYGLPISAAGLAALTQLHPEEARAAQKQEKR